MPKLPIVVNCKSRFQDLIAKFARLLFPAQCAHFFLYYSYKTTPPKKCRAQVTLCYTLRDTTSSRSGVHQWILILPHAISGG